MGADWIRATEKKFRRRIQKSALQDIRLAELYVPEEKISVTYVCHWLAESFVKPVGTTLRIFQRSQRSYVAVMLEKEVIAQVRGEAAEAIKLLFLDNPKLCNILPVVVIRVGQPSEPFYVQAIGDEQEKGLAAAK